MWDCDAEVHPKTQYAMRHSDVQMISFGADHNSGSWLCSVIDSLSSSMQVRWINIFRTKPTERNALLSLDDNCSMVQIRRSDKLAKDSRKY